PGRRPASPGITFGTGNAMPLIATPDFGASGGFFLFLAFVGFVVLVGALLLIVRGVRVLRNGSANGRTRGVILLLIGALLPLLVYSGPSGVFRLVYGSYPTGRYPNDAIRKGMSADEVMGAMGPPHKRTIENGESKWYYYVDSFGMSWFGVDFGPDD